MLHPSNERRERICVYGPSDSGKTSCAVSIANWIARTKSPAKMFYVDTDGTAEASIPGELLDDGTVILYDIDDRAGMKAAMKAIKPQLSRDRNDWLVVDSAEKPWKYAQDAFFELSYGIDSDDFFLDAKRQAKERAEKTGKGEAIGDYVAGDHGINWQIINKMYGEMTGLYKTRNAHVLLICPPVEVRKPDRSGKGGDDPEVIDLFTRVGIKPAGQKDLPLLPHTILLLQKKAGGGSGRSVEASRIVNTLKERVPLGMVGRERLTAAEMTVERDFVITYLMGVAKWRP
jgi:hypothetical protein